MESDIMTANIVREIVNKCRNNGLKIEESFITYYVKLLHLDPAWGITADVLMNRTSVHKFVEYCVSTMKKHSDPFLVILKVQFHFKKDFLYKDVIIEHNRTALQTRLEPLEKEILQTKKLTQTEDYDKFYKRIVYFVTLLSGLGNPTVSSVYKEANIALQSIFLESDVTEFLKLSKHTRSDHLIELTELVTGVRLLNKDSRKGGEGIEDLPSLLKQALEAVIKDLQKLLVFIMDRANIFTTAVDNCYKIKENDSGYFIQCELPEGVNYGELEYYKDLLVLYRQYEVYARRILAEVKNIQESANNILSKFREVLVELHETIRYRTAIPTHLVFPKFTKLSEIWCSLQDETIFLAKLNQIVIKLQTFVTDLSIDEGVLKLMMGLEGSLTDVEIPEKKTGQAITRVYKNIRIFKLSKIKDFDEWPLEYLGFCAWKLVETQGALIPGNANLGVVRYNNKYYLFSCVEAADAFCKQPERYINEALVLARKKVELINFLQLYNELVNVQNVEELVQKPPPVVLTFEADTQTEMHPLEANINPDYMWNIWDLKRNALLLTNLVNHRSKITQTMKISTQLAVKTQTYEFKDKNLQTKKDNYSNVPKPSNFIYGLRGRKDDQQFTIQLTRPVQE